MKKKLTVLFVVTILAVLLVLAPTGKKGIPSPPVVHAQEQNSSCSPASLNGLYSVEGNGSVVAQLPGLPAPPFPFGEVGIDNFDGAGTWSGHVTANLGGLVVPVTVAGTYTVNGDCTGTRTFSTSLGLTAHDAIVVTGGGRGIIATDTDPSAVVQRKLQRLGD